MTSEGLRHPGQEPDEAAPGVGGTPYDDPAARATDPSRTPSKADGSTGIWPSTATTSSGWEPAAPAVGAASVAPPATSWPAPTASTPQSTESSRTEDSTNADFPPDWGTPANPYPPPAPSPTVAAAAPSPEASAYGGTEATAPSSSGPTSSGASAPLSEPTSGERHDGSVPDQRGPDPWGATASASVPVPEPRREDERPAREDRPSVTVARGTASVPGIRHDPWASGTPAQPTTPPSPQPSPQPAAQSSWTADEVWGTAKPTSSPVGGDTGSPTSTDSGVSDRVSEQTTSGGLPQRQPGSGLASEATYASVASYSSGASHSSGSSYSSESSYSAESSYSSETSHSAESYSPETYSSQTYSSETYSSETSFRTSTPETSWSASASVTPPHQPTSWQEPIRATATPPTYATESERSPENSEPSAFGSRTESTWQPSTSQEPSWSQPSSTSHEPSWAQSSSTSHESIWSTAQSTSSSSSSSTEPDQPAERQERPLYQPAPAPIAATPVPLPPQQEVRVPGAALAAALSGEREEAEAALRASASSGYDPQPGWSSTPAEARGETDHGHAGQAVPQPREAVESQVSPSWPTDTPSGDAASSGPVSASAAVPPANRIAPPADPSALSAVIPPPQPRVYGRPTNPQADEQVSEASATASGSSASLGSGSLFSGGSSSAFGGGSASGFGAASPFSSSGAFSGASTSTPEASAPVSPPPFGGDVGQRPTGTARVVPATSPTSGRFEPPGASAAEPPASAPPVVPAPALAPFDPAVHAPQAVPEATSRFEPSGGAVQTSTPEASASGIGSPAEGFGTAYSAGSAPATSEAAGPATAIWSAPDDEEQKRFNAFRSEGDEKPAEETSASEPTPQVRNGRVFLAVLTVAVLLLVVPLGIVWLVTQPGNTFNPKVGDCVKQSGNQALAADCSEPGAYTIVSRVDNKDKCPDPNQPHVMMPGGGAEKVLCLKAASEK